MLEQIAAHKRSELQARQRELPLATLHRRPELQAPTRGFLQNLKRHQSQRGLGLIAELKRASPSKGEIRADFDVAALAQSYQRAGASCLSVLTDERYFRGHDGYLQIARACTSLPVLRKDFVVDAYQVYEAKLLNADCVLLLVALLSDEQLLEYSGVAADLGLDVLVEVHTAAELRRVAALGLDHERHLLGINNRDLRSFQTSLGISAELSAEAGATGMLLVSESGIHNRADIVELQAAGFQSFLIGEAFMRYPDPAVGVATICGLADAAQDV